MKMYVCRVVVEAMMEAAAADHACQPLWHCSGHC
jgi:hypothetical protein